MSAGFAGKRDNCYKAPEESLWAQVWQALLDHTQQRWWQASSPLGAALISLARQAAATADYLAMYNTMLTRLLSSDTLDQFVPTNTPGSQLACAMAGSGSTSQAKKAR